MNQSVNQEQILHYQNKLQYEIDPWDLHQALAAKEAIVVIDARSAEAYQKEHIPGAINFPHRSISKDTAAQQLSFDTQYVTYCDGIGCNASTKSALKLAQLGYKVKELIGGIDWWKRDLYPIEGQKADVHCNSNPMADHCGCDG